jgi:hypothetical protein
MTTDAQTHIADPPRRRGRPPKQRPAVAALAVADLERKAAIQLAAAALDEIIRVSTAADIRDLATFARSKLAA